MALTTAVHNSLPYIDADPTQTERAAAQALIDAELPSESDSHSHPSLPALMPFNFSPIYEQELQRISSAQPLAAIDLSRYEASEPPRTTPSSDTQDPETLEAWRRALTRAHTAHAYLRMREGNMHLLDRFGRNSWLVGNSTTEDVLGGLERELAARKTDIDIVVVERQGAQEAVRGEVQGLQETWRRGVGRVLETEVAAEGLRREVLERRRAGAA